MPEGMERPMHDQSASKEMHEEMDREMKEPTRDEMDDSMDEETEEPMKGAKVGAMDKEVQEGTRGNMEE